MLSRSPRWPVGTARPLANVTLLAPIPRPRKNIFGIGLNYVEHVEESARTLDTATDLPKQPVIFSKPPTTVIGPGQPVVHRADITQQLDWEVELAVVIGTAASRSEEHTSELQSLMRISYAVFCLKKKHIPTTKQDDTYLRQ